MYNCVHQVLHKEEWCSMCANLSRHAAVAPAAGLEERAAFELKVGAEREAGLVQIVFKDHVNLVKKVPRICLKMEDLTEISDELYMARVDEIPS